MLWRKRLKSDASEKRKQLNDDIEKEGGLEKHDFFAMIVSAFIVILPVAILVLLLLAFIGTIAFLF